MNGNTTTVKKLIQITEETQPPVHVPVVFGNECFIVTQQDLRKIEDIRLLSYSKLLPNGEVLPMETLGHDLSIRDAILNAANYRMQLEQNTEQAHANMLLEFVARVLGHAQQMEQEATPTVATLEQQLQWAKAFNQAVSPMSSSPLPQSFLYSPPMSSNDCSMQSITYDNNNNSNNNHRCTRGSNTEDTYNSASKDNAECSAALSAMEQWKQKKIAQEFT